MPIHRFVHRSLVLLALATLAAWWQGSPDQQERAVIEKMEQAAENRDIGDLKAALSEDYRDAQWNGGLKRWRAMRGLLHRRRPFITHSGRGADFPEADGEGRAQVLVGVLGRDAAAGNRTGPVPRSCTASKSPFAARTRTGK